MMSMRRSEVPFYLRNSCFYLSLSADDDEELSFPIDSVKLDDSVTDETSLRDLLSSLRFWGANSIPDGLYDAALNPLYDFYVAVASEFEYELSYAVPLRSLLAAKPQDRLVVAAQSGSIELVKYLINRGYECSARVTEAAAAAGHLACLKYLHSIGCSWDAATCVSAAKNGHFECLQFAHSHGCLWSTCYMAHYAAARGCVRSLAYAAEHGCALTSTMYIKSASANAVDCLRYLHSECVALPNDFLLHTVGEDSLQCVEFALERGCTFGDNILSRVRSVECLQLLHDTGYQWTEQSAASAAKHGVELLQFLHEHNCPWDERTALSSITTHKVTDSNEPDIECMAYALQHGCPTPSDFLLRTIGVGNLPAVKYLMAHGHLCDVSATAMAARSGKYNMLVYLHSQDVPWDETTTTGAANANHVNCLKYAYTNHCPMDPDIGRYPASMWCVEAVKYLHSIGFKQYSLPKISTTTY